MIPNRVFRFWLYDDSPIPEIREIQGSENILITRQNCEIPDEYAKGLFDARDKKFHDYIQFWYLHKYGGVYVDCDVVQLKPLADLLDNRFFAGRQGAEDDPIPVFRMVCTAVVGCEPGHPLALACMKQMREMNPAANLVEYSMGTLNELINQYPVTIYPKRYFYPFSWVEEPPTEFGEDTYLVHLWAGSWVDPDVPFDDCFKKMPGY